MNNQERCEQIARLATEMAHSLSEPAWMPVSQVPEDDSQIVVVKTATGAKYFSSTINGKFMRGIVAWTPLPKE